jgi:cytochrome c biogenesis protein
MRPLERFLLSKRTALTVTLLLLCSVVVSYLVPQATRSPSELSSWMSAHPGLASIVRVTGSDHVFSTWWFAALLVLFLASIAAATAKQASVAARRTRGGVAPASRVTVTVASSVVEAGLRRLAYRRIGGDEHSVRFVRNVWGYWGGAVLHVGMVIAIGASLVAVLTQQRGNLLMVRGERLAPGGAWSTEDHGIFAKSLRLPGSVTLESIRPEYWENDDLKQLTTRVTVRPEGGGSRTHELWVNRTVVDLGVRIYQGSRYGDAFDVEFAAVGTAPIRQALIMGEPERRTVASYADFRIQGIPYEVKAKYFADAKRAGMVSQNPLLVLRLLDGAKVVAELPLTPGGSGRLGPYDVRLAGVTPWVEMVFVHDVGVAWVFAGFFVIFTGAGLIYMTPPREVWLVEEDSGWGLSWRASKFAEMYRDEHRRIVDLAGGQEPDDR